MRQRIEVAAAVLERPDGSFLLAQRPPGKPYAGYWEFPGGKIEAGESAMHGLKRELHEELGIDVSRAYSWLTRDYDYEHAAVRLRFFRVLEWSGELHGREDQAFTWQRIGAIRVSPVLPANGPIFKALGLPQFLGVTNAAEVAETEFMTRMERALGLGLKLIQLREKSLDEGALAALASRVIAAAHAYGARVVINGAPVLAASVGADGVHLTASRLMELGARPAGAIVGASCHDARELARAAALSLDYVILGPVKATASHAGAAPLGWTRFGELVEAYPLPVYAIGGLAREDLPDAWSVGAHGIAALRAAWS